MKAARIAKLEKLEQAGSRMIVAKLAAGVDLDALLISSGIQRRASDLVVRLVRPDGCGADFARVI